MGVLSDARTQHRYQTCSDEDCQRFACRVYREGCRRGRDEDEAIGEAWRHARCHAERWAAGYAACAAGCAGKQ
jgi:hypothetical protein